MDDRKPILTVYADDFGIEMEIDADGTQLIMIVKAIAEALIEQTGTEAH